jgi:hypothetical protein
MVLFKLLKVISLFRLFQALFNPESAMNQRFNIAYIVFSIGTVYLTVFTIKMCFHLKASKYMTVHSAHDDKVLDRCDI